MKPNRHNVNFAMIVEKYSINKKGVEFYQSILLGVKIANRRALVICVFFAIVFGVIFHFTWWTMLFVTPSLGLTLYLRYIFISNASKSIPFLIQHISIFNLIKLKLRLSLGLRLIQEKSNFQLMIFRKSNI